MNRTELTAAMNRTELTAAPMTEGTAWQIARDAADLLLGSDFSVADAEDFNELLTEEFDGSGWQAEMSCCEGHARLCVWPAS